MKAFAWLLGAIALLSSLVRASALDQPSAVLLYPYVVTDAELGLDTLIQLTNTSSAPVEARCFYEDLTPACFAGTAGESCGPGPVTCSGYCKPLIERIPFRVQITPRQPLAWRLSAGLRGGPLDGVERTGPNGASNQLTDIPEVPNPMVGTLRCVVVGADLAVAASDNVLVGLATLRQRDGAEQDQYRAIGLRAREGDAGPDRDEFLRLGGAEAEYESCPAVIPLQHFFDNGPLQTGDRTAHVEPGIVLATCSAPPTDMGNAVAQYLVYNEFGQRFSTSRAVQGQMITRLTSIDTTQPNRSIFSVSVAGTLAGQTLIRGIGSSLVAIGHDTHVYSEDDRRTVAYNLHGTGGNPVGDIMTFRGPRCIGDCDLNGSVRVNELVAGVNIALDQLGVDRCREMDEDGSASVTVNELVIATNASLGACPEPVKPPTPAPTPRPTPGPPAFGPEITLLGLTTADDRPIETDLFDEANRPVFELPYGQGVTILVEARRGPRFRDIGHTTYVDGPLLPHLQILVSNPLGDGGIEVCEDDGVRGGVPGNPTLDFDAEGATDAINDLGCRAFNRTASLSNTAFTRPAGAEDVFRLINPASQVQFGVPIAKAWAFPSGETIVAVRVRDVGGELSPVEEIVVRVSPP